jgi:hypothetical protein
MFQCKSAWCDNVSVGQCLPKFRCNVAPSPSRLSHGSWFFRNVDKHPATLRHSPENLKPRNRYIRVISGTVYLYNRKMCLLRGGEWTFHIFQVNFVFQRVNKKLRKLERWGVSRTARRGFGLRRNWANSPTDCSSFSAKEDI